MNEEKQTLTQFIRENAFKLAAIIVTIVNLWIATELAPLQTRISVIDQRVTAIEKEEPMNKREYEEILKRLNRIEEKLDRHLFNER